MKPIFLSIFVLLFLPNTLSVASSTAEQELGTDNPESQLLTHEEIAKYKRIRPGFLERRDDMQRELRPDGLHIFSYLPESVDANCKIECPPYVQVRLYPEQRMFEFYFTASQIREVLNRDVLNEAPEEKNICCLIL